MKYLYFSSSDIKVNVGLFKSYGEIKDFLKSFLKEELIQEDIHEIILKQDDFPEYEEVEINGNIIPITKFAFIPNEEIYVNVEELCDFSKKGKGIIDLYTVIENYAIGNKELKEYIDKREKAYKRVKKALEKRGFSVNRELQGSQDGEAITISGKGDRWLFSHLDPSFVENLPQDEEKFQNYIDEELK